MELKRTFLAVPPDARLQARLRDVSPVGAGHARDTEATSILEHLRWAEPDDLHITLVFLGATTPEQIVALHTRVMVLARSLRAFAYALVGPRLFPDAQRPRVLVLEPVDASGFALWQAPLATACAELGFAPEARRYRPHLSIARLRRAPRRAVAPCAVPLAGEAREIVLYESRAGRYTPLFAVDCGGAERAA